MQLLGNSNIANRGGGAQTDEEEEEEEEQGGGVASSPASPGQGSVVGSLSGSGSNVREKKPAKVIPCPRCESMNTKFCYFNNYSTKQPRYFCRQCQRYWTVGGILRNVPVGGGSRKKSRSQRSEPFFRSATHGGGGGGGVAPLNSATAALSGNHPLLQHTLGFQQLLMQDVNLPYSMMTAYELQGQHLEHQNPGLFYPVINKSMNNNTQELSAMHAMYASSQGGVECGSDPVAQGANHPMLNVYGSYHCTPNNDNGDFLHVDSISQVIQWGNLLPTEQLQTESIWNKSRHHQNGSPACSASDEEEINRRNCSSPQAKLQVVKAESHELCNNSNNNISTMLLQHLSLNKSNNINKPGFEGCCLAPSNGSSPPHGSSTIEEEGSTPTNGYSTNGYEEGDAISTMWPDFEFFH